MPTATGRARNKKGEGDRLRRDLLTATTELLREQGTDARLSLREVTRRAGVSPPAMYLHFADKQAVVDAVLAEQFSALTDELASAVTQADDDAGALRAGCLAYLEFAERDPAMYRLLFEGGITRPTDAPPDRDQPGRQTFQYLVSGLTRCQDSGVVPPGDQEPVATMVWTALHGLATLRRSNSTFPWPPVEPLLDELLHRIAGLPRPS